jgi:hypothetical protein
VHSDCFLACAWAGDSSERARGDERNETAGTLQRSAGEGELTKIISMQQQGVGWANMLFRTERKQQPLYCEPSSLMLTGEQIVDMMDRYVREHPSMGRVAWQLIMIRALQEVFPCTSARP